jgi:hypothetical protein
MLAHDRATGRLQAGQRVSWPDYWTDEQFQN